MISEVGVTYQKPWTWWQMIFYICSHTIRAIKCHFDANKASLLALLDGVVEENGIVVQRNKIPNTRIYTYVSLIKFLS